MALLGLLASNCAYSQTYVNSVVFSYDNNGNRIKREVKVICIDCAEEGPGSSGKFSNALSDTLGTEGGQVTSGIASITAYPNPMVRNLTIENPHFNPTDIAEVKIFDANGKYLEGHKVTSNKVTLQFHEKATGTYHVHYYLDDELLQAWKIVKTQ